MLAFSILSYVKVINIAIKDPPKIKNSEHPSLGGVRYLNKRSHFLMLSHVW